MMRKWLPRKFWGAVQPRISRLRWFSSFRDVQHIKVPCASSGETTVSLYNVSDHSSTTPLVIWIPPFSFQDGYDPSGLLPPRWLQYLPVAAINYRWPGLYSDPPANNTENPLHWPTPLHDVLFGYQWITQHLAPPDLARRDVYVYGSYLGASLAASLALTESHLHEPMAVRGLITYNGIYNWTTFLPDHPMHRTTSRSRHNIPEGPLPDPHEEGSPFHLLRQSAPLLFHSPANLFDPFASACLFFHTSGMHVPSDFWSSSSSSEWTRAVDALSGTITPDSSPSPEGDTEIQIKPSRKSHLVFPPRKSTLQIPSTLLLYDPPPPLSFQTPRGRRKTPARINTFRTQAGDLASLMIRSVEMLELKDRMRWDHEFEDPAARADEAERRVWLAQVGGDDEGGGDVGLGLLDLNVAGERLAGEWLMERVHLRTR